MANKAFPTIPGTIDIPSGVEDFKTRQQVVWTASSWRQAPSNITITHGPSAGQVWGSTESFEIRRQENMYQPQQTSGFMAYANASAKRTTIFEMNGNSRWMPASVFNGIGFETYHQHISGPQDHEVYLADYAVTFRHRTGSGTRYYGWGTGYTSSPGHLKYRFDRIQTSDSHVNDIRAWGSDWLYQGLVVALRTKEGGSSRSDQSYITIYNMKVGSKFSTIGGAYRYLPLANRSSTNRDGSVGNKGFSNPFQL